MPAKQRVTFVELTVYQNTVPLVAGYLEVYATQDPRIRESFVFDTLAASVSLPAQDLLGDLLDRDSDIYAFSCYIWNMGLVRQVLGPLRAARPQALIVLGGPQVMGHYREYVDEGEPRVVVCNGEGEHTFYELLLQALADEPDFGKVPDITYWAPGAGVAETERTPRNRELDAIPSPFASGLFDGGEYTFTVLETNRGCPFSCGFCFWGAATQSKVYKFDEQRVERDIEWIAKNGVASVFIADANWGMSPRDVELSRHIVRMKERYGFPTSITIAAAKNRPERVAEITDILVKGGLVTSQPISMQTVNPTALELIDRSNIREDAYTELQRSLHERNTSSFIELIWPLPGETLASFKAGVARLCRMGADTITVYPQLLLHNTSLHDQREALGLVVERAAADAAEADVVVATNWVTRAECDRGTWFYYAVHCMHNARGLYHVGRYLDQSGIVPYEQFFTDVSDFLRAADSPVPRFFAESVDTADNYSLLNIGKVAHMVLQDNRAEFDELLAAFCRAQHWWADEAVPLLLEIDLLARPYIYRRDVALPGVGLSRARVLDVSKASIEIELAEADVAILAGLGVVGPGGGRRVVVTHPLEGKMPYPRLRGIDYNAAYCHVMIQRLRTLLPMIAVHGPAVGEISYAGNQTR
ncbi:MAG TPA: cobalamin-dependent protein [Streptosporangiaceae bacterium]|nr:cobalamin-dependent protein [Streptosporangiaceae bacterium]